MSHTALLPCPFCTSEAELCCALTGDWKSAIRCSSCGAKTGWKPDDEAAIDAWNTRHDSQRVAALEEAGELERLLQGKVRQVDKRCNSKCKIAGTV